LFIITGAAIFVGVIALIWNNVNSQRSERTIVLKILINYLQTLSFLGGFDFIWSYSKAILGIFQASSTSNISVGIFTVYCAVQWNQYQKFLLYMLIPVFGCIGVIGFFFSKHARECNNKKYVVQEFLLSSHWKSAKSTILVFFFLLHPTLTQQIFEIFQCTQYGDNSYLATDLSISCDGATYQKWRAAAILMILLYVVGIPLFGFSFVFNYREHLDDPSVKRRFRFLYEGYSRHAYYWEFIIIARKVILVAIVVFLKNQTFRSVLAGLWLLIAALLAHVWVAPFSSPSLEGLETSALSVLLATLLFGLYAYSPGFSASEQTFSAVAVIGLNVIMTLILISVLLYLYYNMLSKLNRLNTLLETVQRYFNSRKDRRENRATPEPDEGEGEEMYDIDSKYFRSSTDVTAESLRQGRAQFNLKMDGNDVSLSNIQLGRLSSPSMNSLVKP